MGYSFSPTSKDEAARSFINKRGKQMVIAVAVAFLIGIFYFTGTTLTTYATYNKNLEQELTDTKGDLTASQLEADSCQQSLDASNSQLQTCTNDLSSSKSSLQSCTSEKNDLTDEVVAFKSAVEACEGKITSSSDSFKQLAKNSVRPICCSFGDMQNGATRNWDIVNNSISCSGSYTVNCATGETNY
ncbi:MAG TPA: hypothetical protein VJH04_00610 [archaeon]|nr:hypothetical protein [archaeon]